VSGLSPKPSRRLKTGHTIPEALLIAKDLTQKNLFQIGDAEIANEAELGYPGEEAMQKALLTALEEVTPLDYRPPGQPDKIPGIPFVWSSKCFKTSMYLKFKLMGTKRKPVLWWYSCHPATDFKL
jgi:hypothetical protein